MNKTLRIIILSVICLSTKAQISLVKQFDRQIANFETLGNKILFNVESQGGEPELWVSDGSESGTFIIPSAPPLTSVSTFRSRVGNYIFWYVNGEIWKSDGTISGTVKVKDGLPSCNNLVNLNGILVFTGEDDLWRSDGTTGGTYKIKDDIVPYVLERTAVYNGYLYFMGGNAISNFTTVWRTDGTTTGTTEIPNGGYKPLGFNVINNKLIYSAFITYPNCETNDSGFIRVIVQMDGSNVTVLTPVNCIPSNPFGWNNFESTSKFFKAGNYLYFKGGISIVGGFGSTNLFRTDGTVAGTIKLTNFIPSSLNEGLDNSFWDGSMENDFGFDNIFLFPARTSNEGIELWRSDGTAIGTYLLKDFIIGAEASNPKEFRTINGLTYFYAKSVTYGMELWKSDGTANGTQLVEQLNRSAQNVPFPTNFPFNGHEYGINMGNGYYFSGIYNNINGLYKTCISPFPVLSATNTTICAGSNTTLSASGCNGIITWNTGATTSSIVVSPGTSTTYSATCTEGVCSTSITNSLTITVNPVPVIAANTGNLCAGQSITLTASGVTAGIQWQRNGSTIASATNATYSPTQAGTYRAIVIATQCYSNEIIVKPIPAVPAITSSASNSICAGQSTTLTVSNCAGSVTWLPSGSGSAISVSPGSTTTYTATCTENACINTNTINIVVNPLPAAPVASIFNCTNTPTKVWEKKYGGTHIESPYKVLELSDGNLLWVGVSSSAISGDKTVSNSAGDDAWIIKTDAAGTTKIWDKVYGGTGGDYPYASIATSDGGAIIALGSNSGMSGNKTIDKYGSSGNDIWVIKINSSGVIENQWIFGGTLDDNPKDIIQTSDGNYVLAAVSYSADGTGNKSIINGPISNTINGDIWIIKFNPASTSATGASVWQATYGGNSLDEPAKVMETPSGDLLIAGSSKSIVSGNKTSVSHDGGAGQSDYWVLKIKSNASAIVWQQSYGGAKASSDPTGQSYGDDNLTSIAKSNTTGRYVLGGTSKSQASTGNKTVALKGDNDGWLVEINESDGAKVAEKAVGGANKDDFYEVLRMPNGTGYWLSMRVTNTNSGDITASALGLTDIWVAEIDNNFSLAPRWDRRYGGAYEDGPRSAIITSTGQLIVGGYQASSATNTNGIAQDYYAVKISECTAGTTATMCTASTVNLYASGCNGTIQWSNGSSSNSISVNIAGTYTATCTSFVTNCTSSASNALVVNFASTNAPAVTGTTICTGNSTTLTATGCSGTYKWYSSETGTTILASTAAYATPVLNTTTAYYTSCTENNCESSRTLVTVNVEAKPNAPTVASPNPICVGGSANISAAGCTGSVTWTGGLSGNTITVSPAISRTYRAACTNENSCTSDSSTVVTLVVNPLPSAPVISTVSCENTLTKIWDKRFGGSNYEELRYMLPTNDRGYLLGGYSNSDISGDKTQASQGGNDYWIVKIDADGIKLWDKRFGGNTNDILTSMLPTNDGGYLLGGWSESGNTGDKSQTSQGYSDYWIVKTDANGTKIWDKRFGGSNADILRSILPTNDGGYLLGGESYSGFSGDKSQVSQGGLDFWIVKIDANGTKLWDKRFGGINDDVLWNMINTGDGGYLLGGFSWSDISGDKSQSSRGDADYWVLKIDANGTKIWDKTFGGSDMDFLTSVVQTSDGGYLLTGESGSGISGEKSHILLGDRDCWLVKIDANGTKMWDKRFGGNGTDWLPTIVPVSDGGYLLGGGSSSDISGEKSEKSQGDFDYWIVKIDVNGTKIWDKAYGGANLEGIGSILPISDGGYLLGGGSDSGISGDKSQSSQGGRDFWVLKVNECLNPIAICPGQNVKLTASGCTETVNWSNGMSGSTITINSAGTYTATCTVNNCGSSLSNSIVITNVPANLSLANTATNGVQKALDSITSTQTVPVSTNVTYQAGKSINLQGVFQAQPGSVFKAEIKGCDN
ncbi:3-coathanger stack domain-containing protein [Emticicia sp. BO119]|uniref:Ig-like domain-containing protein n=1 Tax=Emticicia sp. BO119 TaxID=2757768 RepID=UPI0015F0B74E|nr:3-coathanger stack domain-containing protein [Emticicia sp. BO119]MBA4850567.1 hypothetical protein [Emticicia sp. BO119]